MNKSHVKNLGQVSAVVVRSTPPKVTFILWYDTTVKRLKYYDPNVSRWVLFDSLLVEGVNLENDYLEPQGEVFSRVEESKMYFRKIKGVQGVKVETVEDTVLISLEHYLEVSQREIEVSSVVGSKTTITVSSDISWEIVDLPSWLSATPNVDSNTKLVTLEVLEPNITPNTREITVTLRPTVDSSVMPSEILISISQLVLDKETGNYSNTASDRICEIK